MAIGVSDKVRVGIIGCGGIANNKHMPALQKLPDVEMVAFCDTVRAKAEAARAAFGAEGATVYDDYRKLLEDRSVDVVHVCTPNRSHSFITVDALHAGKDVLCEKPMAISADEAKKMLDTARMTGRKLTIGYQNRQRNDSLFLKKHADSGALGEIYYAKATALRRRAVPTWGVFLNEHEQGGGPLIDIGTHALDLTLWVMNNYAPKYCLGTTYHKLNGQTNTGNVFGDWNPAQFSVEDSAFGFVVMENGATIVLESAWALNTLDVREAVTAVCGTLGGADMTDTLRINEIIHGRQCVTHVDLGAGGVAFYEGDGTDDPATREARQWIDAVISGKDPTVLPEQAYTVTRILEGIYESAKTGTVYRF